MASAARWGAARRSAGVGTLMGSRNLRKGSGDVVCGSGLGLGDGGGDEAVMSELVDLSGQSLRGLEDGLDGGGLEERQLGSRASKQVGEGGAGLVAREGRQVEADDDA